MSFSLAEISYLATAEADPEDYGLTRASSLDDAHLARTRHGEYGRAVLELLTARKSGKIPATWFGDTDSVQQATPPEIVAERARRLAPFYVHDVTCSIGTEARFITGEWIGSDISLPRLEMARLNLPERPVFQADALTVTSRNTVIVADPARRSGGRRIRETIPPLDELIATWHGRDMAIKCAPGLDYSFWEGLVTVSSVDGGVKETCLYTPGLSADGARREAIIHAHGNIDRVTDLMDDDVPVAEPGRYIIDPDGAIIRAGLVRHFAAREGLWMLDERIAHLTGDSIPKGYSGFEVLEQVPIKKLASAVRTYNAGSAEILVRGADIDPDTLRKKLKLRGERAISIVITRIGRTVSAFICGPRQKG